MTKSDKNLTDLEEDPDVLRQRARETGDPNAATEAMKRQRATEDAKLYEEAQKRTEKARKDGDDRQGEVNPPVPPNTMVPLVTDGTRDSVAAATGVRSNGAPMARDRVSAQQQVTKEQNPSNRPAGGGSTGESPNEGGNRTAGSAGSSGDGSKPAGTTGTPSSTPQHAPQAPTSTPAPSPAPGAPAQR